MSDNEHINTRNDQQHLHNLHFDSAAIGCSFELKTKKEIRIYTSYIYLRIYTGDRQNFLSVLCIYSSMLLTMPYRISDIKLWHYILLTIISTSARHNKLWILWGGAEANSKYIYTHHTHTHMHTSPVCRNHVQLFSVSCFITSYITFFVCIVFKLILYVMCMRVTRKNPMTFHLRWNWHVASVFG